MRLPRGMRPHQARQCCQALDAAACQASSSRQMRTLPYTDGGAVADVLTAAGAQQRTAQEFGTLSSQCIFANRQFFSL